MKVMEHLLKSVRAAGIYNPEIQVAPACILWPDRERQWETIALRLQAELPELLALGDYAPERRTGPAIWLRCVIAGVLDDSPIPKERTPILYLPGVSRQDLRAVESCPEYLKPLAELQYRGVIWSQINAKDWTILAFLKSDQGGLGLDVAQDSDAKVAMQLALHRVLDEDLERLKGKRLDRDYFNTLLSGGDPIRDLLQWLDQNEAFRASRGESEWNAFVQICRSQLAFNPQNEGVLAGAAKLADRKDTWGAVWERYSEAPKRYPNIPLHIRKCQPSTFDLFADEDSHGGWPQWNEQQETDLRQDLLALQKLPAHEARTRLLALEKQHTGRRDLVWAELGEAPLARAIKSLAVVAQVTQSSLAVGTVQDMATSYVDTGWKADDAVLRALGEAHRSEDEYAISTAIRTVYLPWAEDAARYLQKSVDGAAYPGGTCLSAPSPDYTEGECVLFVDGLRFDTGKRLLDRLERAGFSVAEKPAWTALPSVTATGKAAVTPVRQKIRGHDNSTDFEPAVAVTGQSLKGGYHLKKLLQESGWTVLERTEMGDGTGTAWCEFGDIDHEGHNRGWKLARHIDALLGEIQERITSLLKADWQRVRVVTDHGWLLLPGGLPKIELPSALADSKWGRCAALKPGASSNERLFPWYWNPQQHFALADGISCYKRGEDYSHGGLSLQECLTLQLTVSRDQVATASETITITDMVWKGLRCTVAVEGECGGLKLDIRSQPGNSDSSLVLSLKPFKSNGTASVVVEDEELEGQEASVVLLNAAGAPVAQAATVIGGGGNA